jgi:subtilisin family serine protease
MLVARHAQAQPEVALHHLPGVVLVAWREGGAPQDRGDVAPRLVVPSLGVYALVAPLGEEEEAAAWRADPRVRWAEPDYRANAAGGILPHDPLWPQQWSLAAIGMPEAWEVISDTQGIVVAVVDAGVALDHPDLVAALWRNAGEVPGNGVDDDGNGQRDDVWGWHYYHTWTGNSYQPAEDAQVADDYGHGTHVAGIVGAAANNGQGMAGVAWGARVMAVKVLDQDGQGWYSDIAAGITYAADNGARIIVLSLGGAAPSATLCAAAEYAWRKGCLLVAATGNSGGAVLYPAACEHVLGVAATDERDAHAAFANRGAQVDLAAPGVSVLSTWPWREGYWALSGTSVAAPHVAGVAALAWARWPQLTNDALAMQITRTALDVESLGWDPFTGWGRLDAARAVSQCMVCAPDGPRLWLPLLGGYP